MTINLLFETFSECSPIIYIKPIVIQSLIPYQNLGCVNILYLENLLINGIDIPNTYTSLINILNSLKENDLSNGLKYFFNENKKIKNAYAELQANNYINAENIFYECVNKLNEDILKDENNINENIYNELSLWDEGLTECYEKSDKWSYIKELGDFSNNKEMVLKSLWFDKKEENLNLQKYNADLISDNKKLNQKMNKLLKEISLKENDFNIKIYDTNSKLNEANKENRNTLDDLQKCKQEKETVIQDLEKYCNFVNQKLNEINDFLITSFNASDLTKLSEEINYSQNLNESKYGNNNNIVVNDIKFELVENTIFEMKKNILKYIVTMREKNNNYMNEFNNLSKDRNILETQNNEIINELNKYKENNKELESINQEISTNYEKLKDTYYKLYEEYNLFTNSNSKYINDTHKFYFDLISKIKNLFDDKSQIDNEKDLDQILEEYIDILINKYNTQIRKNEENNEKEKDTYNKVMEISNLLEDSQNIIKKYEEENKNLKDENEKLNYRYNLLKASIDIVEYKLKSES
jgi:hypothetical protein